MELDVGITRINYWLTLNEAVKISCTIDLERLAVIALKAASAVAWPTFDKILYSNCWNSFLL